MQLIPIRYMAEMGLKSIHARRRSKSLTDSRKARGSLNIGYVTDNIDLTIPPNTQQIQIQLQPGSSSRLGFGDAYFSK